MRHPARRAWSVLVSWTLVALVAAPAWAQAPERPQLRVLTYNIHHGRGMDGVFDYDRLARIINDLEPDLVAVQEVDQGVRRSGRVDQPAILGKLTGLHHAFGNALYYQGGEYGEALLSRFPLEAVKAHHLPFHPGLEPRTALAARVRPGGGLPELLFIGTHLCHQQEDTRTEQTTHLHALFGAVDVPVILAGDLNARPGSAPMDVLLAEHWTDAIAPQSRIDYILYRKSDPWHVVDVQIVDEPVASDHQPVLAVLEWRGPAPQHAEPEADDDASREPSGPVARFRFDGDLGGALRVRPTDAAIPLTVDAARFPLAANADWSVQFRVRTTADADQRFVLLSQKDLPDHSLAAQKHAGWAIAVSHGTWAWTMGSGDRRITYERDNGEYMPVNDGRWHQLTMTHEADASVVRLYYDGRNMASYNIRDARGFDFATAAPLTVGWDHPSSVPAPALLPAITEGAALLQELVDAFNALAPGVPPVEPDELMLLVIDSQRLFDRKRSDLEARGDAEALRALESADPGPVERLTDRLMQNPYTVHQVADFMKVAPLLKIYRLIDGRVAIDPAAAASYAARERLDPPDFDLDDLALWDRALTSEEVLRSFAPSARPAPPASPGPITSLTAAAWNIHHGGLHETIDEDGWDSRRVIAEIIRRENIDIVMMQETYSAGDVIAAELGYHFATTIDWDYLNQGSNISVLSRYPIEEVLVPPGASFMNVAARIRLSDTQDVFAMSNWYGMRNFPEVFEFHRARFDAADDVPILFAGDFNAVPHTDGGDSPASRKLLGAGFTDAYRQAHPDAEAHPGVTHESGARIDQLYFKGAGLTHTGTTVRSTWPSRFPSDHYLIKSTFALVPSRALDRPAEVPVPPDVDLARSFTFRMSVKMPAAPDDLPALATNKAWGDGEIRDYTTNADYGLGRASGAARGFAISVLPDGAWTWNAGNGESRIDHRPEAADQGIADGRWHEVGFALDQERGVAHLFHDGRRVALHDLRGVRDLRSDLGAIQIGPDRADIEIGAVRLEPGVLSTDRLTREFVARFGEARRPPAPPAWNGRPLRVLAWNIWHGGRRKGRDEGVQRVVDVIRQCDADVVLMQETYGSGPRISGRLGFDYFLRSSNLSVMSRFPIVDVHRLGEAFRFGGVTIELRAGVEVQAYSLWINHLPSVQEQLAAGATADELAAADAKTRGREMRSILDVLMPHLAQTPGLPVIVGGDFNSGSHLDWTDAAAALPNHAGRVVAWPVSRMMQEAGFVDTFRAARPDPVGDPGLTWSPEFPSSHQDRIDYVYVGGRGWYVEEAVVLSEHPRGWPSDHAAVLSVLRLDPE